jgi:septum formation protein
MRPQCQHIPSMTSISSHQPTASNATTLILASSSPYRRMLLQRLGLPFQCISPDVDESVLEHEQASTYVSRLAQHKARTVAAALTGDTARSAALIIGSDQALVLGDSIISKPDDRQNAAAMLQQCSAQTVVFHCGWCLLLRSATGKVEMIAASVVPTHVQFRQLSEREIDHYLDRELALDCAGAFKSEALGISLFDAIRSDDPTALIGLPLISVCAGLRKAGLALP